MTRDIRPPIARLLTTPEAAAALGVTRPVLDTMVANRTIRAVHVSTHGGRRFWPSDIASCRGRLADSLVDERDGPLGTAIHDHVDDLASSSRRLAAVSSSPPATLPNRRIPRSTRRPRWAPFTVPAAHAHATYLGFADAEHLLAFVQVRNTLDDGSLLGAAAPALVGPQAVAAKTGARTARAATASGADAA